MNYTMLFVVKLTRILKKNLTACCALPKLQTSSQLPSPLLLQTRQCAANLRVVTYSYYSCCYYVTYGPKFRVFLICLF